jgi:hypothetical protein
LKAKEAGVPVEVAGFGVVWRQRREGGFIGVVLQRKLRAGASKSRSFAPLRMTIVWM